MSATCCSTTPPPSAGPIPPGYRRILWVALVVNAGMFGVEFLAGSGARSSALHADALDFLGDAGNYAISLFVLAAGLIMRAKAALLKGATMGAFGIWVLGSAGYRLLAGGVPEPLTMGVVGALALAANLAVAALLFAYRTGDANMRSVWLCTRNDAIGNIAVAGAAVGVFTTKSGWPDAIVALIMAALALTGARHVIRQASGELRSGTHVRSDASTACPGPERLHLMASPRPPTR